MQTIFFFIILGEDIDALLFGVEFSASNNSGLSGLCAAGCTTGYAAGAYARGIGWLEWRLILLSRIAL